MCACRRAGRRAGSASEEAPLSVLRAFSTLPAALAPARLLMLPPLSVSTSTPRQQVAKLARLCGLEALKNGGVKAYIRQADPFITMPSKKVGLSWPILGGSEEQAQSSADHLS